VKDEGGGGTRILSKPTELGYFLKKSREEINEEGSGKRNQMDQYKNVHSQDIDFLFNVARSMSTNKFTYILFFILILQALSNTVGYLLDG